MRSLTTALACLHCLCLAVAWASHCHATETFPYTAYVDDTSAIVRSGPGTNFYSTDSLDWAAKVEVYRHDDSEWAAIRPPHSSFSWIPSSAIATTDSPDLGVVQTTVKTLIGSRLNDRFGVEYVTLQPGDVVEILGQAQLNLNGSESEPCYKILPPAGEFRWIRRSQLSLRPPSRQTKLTDPLDQPPVPPTDGTGTLVDDDVVVDERMRDDAIALIQFEEPRTPDLKLPSATDGRSSDAPLELLEPPELPPDSARDASDSAPVTAAPANSSRAPEPAVPQDNIGPSTSTELRDSNLPLAPPAFGLPANDEIAASPGRRLSPSAPTRRLPLGPIGKLRLGQELIELELQLTQQVAQTPETWQLAELRSRAQAVIDTSDEVRHRSTGQRIIAKIAQLEDVKRRHETLLAEQNRLANRTNAGNALAYQANPSSSRRPDGPTVVSPSAAIDSSYDGIGWLMPVVTDHPSIPRYVLTDEQGNIRQFVSPKPGMNLSQYEQKRIAVYGQRGYLPTYNQPHLMAERIISLDKIR